MSQMSQEKWEESVGFEFQAIISKLPVPPYIKAGGLVEKGKTIDNFKVDHDEDNLQTYELMVRIWYTSDYI